MMPNNSAITQQQESSRRNPIVLISEVEFLEKTIRDCASQEGLSMCTIDNAKYLSVLASSLKPTLIITKNAPSLLEKLQEMYGSVFSQSSYSSLPEIIKTNNASGFGLIFVDNTKSQFTLYKLEDTIDIDFRLCALSQSLIKGGIYIRLTYAEFSILQQLANNKDTAVSKDQLSESALRRVALPHDRSIDVHISRIRKKTAIAFGRNIIKSVRGVGYQLIHSSY